MAARLTGKARAGEVILGFPTHREVQTKARIEVLPIPTSRARAIPSASIVPSPTSWPLRTYPWTDRVDQAAYREQRLAAFAAALRAMGLARAPVA